MSGYPIGGIGPVVGYQQVTNTGTAANLPSIPSGSVTGAVLAVEGNAIRITFDGSDPTTDAGFPVAAGDTLQISGNVRNIRVISQVGSAVVNVLYFGG